MEFLPCSFVTVLSFEFHLWQAINGIIEKYCLLYEIKLKMKFYEKTNIHLKKARLVGGKAIMADSIFCSSSQRSIYEDMLGEYLKIADIH